MAKQGHSDLLLHGSDSYQSFQSHAQFPAVINLNVGGRYFTTNLSTLTKEPDSMMAAMFSGQHPVTNDQDGRYFIDANGDTFAHILDYLRFKKMPPADVSLDVYEYAVYFGIQSLTEQMKAYEPVVCKIYMEKVKSLYPNFSDCLTQIIDEVKNVGPDINDIQQYSILLRETYGSSEMGYNTHTDDPYGLHFINLLLSELGKKGFSVDVPDAGKSRYDNYYDLVFDFSPKSRKTYTTDIKKMTAALEDIKGDTYILEDIRTNTDMLGYIKDNTDTLEDIKVNTNKKTLK